MGQVSRCASHQRPLELELELGLELGLDPDPDPLVTSPLERAVGTTNDIFAPGQSSLDESWLQVRSTGRR